MVHILYQTVRYSFFGLDKTNMYNQTALKNEGSTKLYRAISAILLLLTLYDHTLIQNS